MIRYAVCAFFLLALAIMTVDVADCHDLFPSVARRFLGGPGPSSSPNDGSGSLGTRWALLVAGSNGYRNYRHQADVCHAYQVLKRGGLKDENIIVFMYDDIANDPQNPRPGVIINHPHGEDVYKGVPKDYVGDQVTVNNFYAAILGNKSAVTGGSRKVLDSGPNDHIFIYYVDHGAPGIIGMPDSRRPYVYANDLIDVLKKKHASGSYKSLVFYLEACEGGSMFEGLLPQGLNIYVTTASNATENSYATYCDFEEFICFGDMYSVAWMEDSETNDLEKETLGDQYQLVKSRTKIGTKDPGSDRYSSSNVVQYGDIKLSEETLSTYMGRNGGPRQNDTLGPVERRPTPTPIAAFDQRDADIFQLSLEISKAPKGSAQESEAQKQLDEALAHRIHVDSSVERIGELLFGLDEGPQVMSSVRPPGEQVVDDWDCLKSTVRIFETYCGSLLKYGMKHVRSFANICNAGVNTEKMSEASAQACSN